MVRSCGNTSTSKHEEIRHNYENGGVSRCLGKSGCPRAAGDQRGEGALPERAQSFVGRMHFCLFGAFSFWLSLACREVKACQSSARCAQRQTGAPTSSHADGESGWCAVSVPGGP